MAHASVMSEVEASKERIAYFKCRLTWNKDISEACFGHMVRNSYGKFMDTLSEGCHGVGRFFMPGVAMRWYTGYFCFIVNDFQEQQSVLRSMKQIAKALCNSENNTYEISERQYIEDVARVEYDTCHMGWDFKCKLNFGGPKDEYAWSYFKSHTRYLKECIARTSRV